MKSLIQQAKEAWRLGPVTGAEQDLLAALKKESSEDWRRVVRESGYELIVGPVD
ncbi:hypothetical protein [Microbacterium sp. SLBN-146]|uniref:hypothetical protein n=1 Tax=Microbacterium sp. SLBN-146 TaxID=2768457 RepID=UPI00135C3FD7|nr:hypothetical protein [Microbacterium sp. SLBN-146]